MKRALAPILLLALTVSPASAPLDASPPAAAFTIVQSSPEHETLVTWALRLYGGAGLDLPPVAISFHDEDEACGGNRGRYRNRDGLHRIWVCDRNDDPEIRRRLVEHTLLHELAHVWTATALDAPARDAFLELRDAATWNSAAAPWHERGNEQAAEIITWGVIDRPIRLGSIYDTACDELRDGYRTLTGYEPAAGDHNRCGGTGSATVGISGATADEAASLEAALARFEEAGMDLPALEIAFHDSKEPCKGNLGLYRSRERRVEICNRGRTATEPINTVMHELAHAWSFAHLDAEAIVRFLATRGLGSWNSGEYWWQRGVEQAAEIVAWGLTPIPYRSIWIHTERCVDLAAAFEQLTGRGPLHQDTSYCKP